MDTVIGWDEEAALAERILERAAGYLSADDRSWIATAVDSGEWDTSIAWMLEQGVPITSAEADLIRRAWVEGYTSETIKASLARALAGAKHLARGIDLGGDSGSN